MCPLLVFYLYFMENKLLNIISKDAWILCQSYLRIVLLVLSAPKLVN